jgi:hypothetical protein
MLCSRAYQWNRREAWWTTRVILEARYRVRLSGEVAQDAHDYTHELNTGSKEFSAGGSLACINASLRGDLPQEGCTIRAYTIRAAQ